MGDSGGRMNGSACKFRREPYRATKLWLEAVAIFRRGVPLGRHRKHLKMYDNCFPSQDAITWFQSQLQIAFDPSITRKQTLTLLQKFYKANIITEVNRAEQKDGRSPIVHETDFKDNGQLYRLVCPSPNGSTTPRRTSTKSVKVESPKKNAMTKSMSQFDVIIKPLTAEEVNEIWGQAFIDRFVKIVGCDVFTSFFQPGLIQGASISYNLTRVGPHNIVIATKKEEDLPHWLVSAMKCLSNWPNNHTQENGVPNYPGFESDVFKLICDYFAQYQKENPLLTYNLYDAFITCFIRAELFDFNSRLYSAKISNASRSRVFQVQQQQLQDSNMNNNTTGKSPMFRMEDQYPFNASESVENLILDILTPSASKGLRKRFIQQHQNQMGLNPRKTLFPVSSSSSSDYCTMSLPRASANESIISTAPMPNPMATKNYELARYTLPLYYETAFTGKESPITRVVSHTELKSSLGERKKSQCSRVRLPAASADAILDGNSTYAYVNPTLELSASDMINHPKYSHILQACDLEGNPASPGPFWNGTLGGGNTSGTSGENTSGSSGGNTSVNGLTSNSLIDDKFMGMRPSRAVSAGNLMDAAGRARPSHNFTLPTSNNSNGPRSPWTPGQSLAAHYSMSPSKSVRRMLEFYYGADACVPGLMTSEGKQLAILSFRLLTLLLPPVNRRHLQILVRFMSKTAHNEKLMLDVAASARAVVINTFFRMILRSEDPEEYDELLALRIVTFLMDNDQEIFAVGDENEILKDAQLKISERQIIKVPTVVLQPAAAAAAAATDRMIRSVSSPTLLRGEDVVEGCPQSDHLVYNEANKENNVRFCSRITMNEYEDQRLLQGTAQSLRDLLDSWVSDEKLDAKEKKRQILKFKATYPHIFREKFGESGEHPSFLNETVMPSKPKKEKKAWKVLRALRL